MYKVYWLTNSPPINNLASATKIDIVIILILKWDIAQMVKYTFSRDVMQFLKVDKT